MNNSDDKFEPLINFKTIENCIKFDEQVVAFDDVEGQLYITTVTKMFRLEPNWPKYTLVRIW